MADPSLAAPEAGKALNARLLDAATQSGVALLAVAAAAGALAGVAAAIVVVTLLVAVAVLGADVRRLTRRDDLEPAAEVTLLGHATGLRALVAAAAAVCFVARDQSATAAVVAAGVVLGVAVLEPVLAQARAYRVTVVAHLPGVRPAPARLDAEGLAAAAPAVAIGAGVLLAAADVSAWWWVVVVVTAGLPDLAMGVNTLARMRADRAIDRSVPAAIAAYAPEFVVYTAWPEDGTHQVTMWLPYLERTGRRYVVVTRHAYPAELLARHTDAPVLARYGAGDLDDLLVPSLTTAFYVNASSGNSIFVRHHGLTHVFLGHGDSDKPTSYNPTHAMYDRIFVAGEAAIRRYAAHGVDIGREKFDVVGRPQVESVRRVAGPVPERPTVLYAPTWRGHVDETAYHSLPVAVDIVRGLIDRGARVIFRPHPFSHRFEADADVIRAVRTLLSDHTEAGGPEHVHGEAAEQAMSVLECIDAADAMVSDVSSVVVDWLQSGKPFAMTAMTETARDFVTHYPVAAAAYVLEGDLSNLDRALDAMLGADPLALERAAVRTDYLGDFDPDHYADAFVDTARRIIDTVPADDADGADGGAAETDAADGGVRISGSTVRRELAVAAREVVSGGLAFAAFAAALLGAPRAVTFSLGLVMLAVSAPLIVRGAARRPRTVAGTLQTGRLILVVALVVGWYDWSPPSWPAAIGLALLAACTAVESTVVAGWERVGLEARHLPTLRVDVHEVVPRAVVGPVDWALLAAAWVVVGLQPDLWGWAVLLGALGWSAAVGAAVAVALRRVFRCVDAEDRLYLTLEHHAPQFAVYFGSNVGAGYQLGMWMPTFEQIGRPFVVVVRTLEMFREIATLTDAPVVLRPTLRSLQEVVVPSLRAAFYVNNAPNNTHFLERRQMAHVWLNHGDSEKPACYNPVHAIYDRIFVAGQAGIDRYARHGVRIPPAKFEIVGRPQVAEIVPAGAGSAGLDHPTVLYAPTWRGPYADSAVSSLDRGEEIVRALLDRGASVIFRSHPFSHRYRADAAVVTRIGAMLAADHGTHGRRHRWGEDAERRMSVADCFNASDAMVSDVSAVVTDYLQARKPFALVAVRRDAEGLRTDVPAARAAYVVAGDLGDLDERLDEMLGTDPLAAERARIRTDYLGDFGHDEYAEGFLQAARRVIDAGPLDEGIH